MEVRETTLHGVLVFEPRPVADHRGFFTRTLSADVLARAGIDHTRLVQESQSRSVRRTIRGMHTRRELTEAKLVRCAHGAVLDVVVDVRPWSPTFLRAEGFELDDRAHRQVYLPPGFLHGFQALSETADVVYRMDAFHQPGLDAAVHHADPELGIEWPLADPILSERDATAPPLRDVRPHLVQWYGTEPPATDPQDTMDLKETHG